MLNTIKKGLIYKKKWHMNMMQLPCLDNEMLLFAVSKTKSATLNWPINFSILYAKVIFDALQMLDKTS